MRGSRLTAVGEEEEIVQQSPAASIQMLTIALKALSQRALIALSSLFMLLTAASVFILWLLSPPDASVTQIVGRSLYAVFVLALNVINIRRK